MSTTLGHLCGRASMDISVLITCFRLHEQLRLTTPCMFVGTGAAVTRRAQSRASTVSTASVNVGPWPGSTSQPRDPSV